MVGTRLQTSFEYLLLAGGVILIAITIGTTFLNAAQNIYTQLQGTPPSTNQPPTVSISLSSVSNLTVTVSVSASDDTGFSSLTIKWGDGTTNTYTLSGTFLSNTYAHTYSSSGTYTITATVSDIDGDTNTDSITVTLSTRDDTPPTITFTATPSTIYEGGSTTLTCSASDPSGISSIKIYKNSGDTAPVKTCTSSPCSITVTYSTAGTYTPVCEAIDGVGNPGEKNIVINVTTTSDFIVSLFSSNKYPDPNEYVYFYCTASHPSGISLVKIYQNVGSISVRSKSYSPPEESVSFTAEFIYRNEGIYHPVCEAQNAEGVVKKSNVLTIISGVDRNEYLCSYDGLVWCPDCLWGTDGKVYGFAYPYAPVWEDANCVGDDIHYPGEYDRYPPEKKQELIQNRYIVEVNALNFSDFSIVHVRKVVRVTDHDDCLQILEDGNVQWRESGGTPIWRPTSYPRWFCHSYNKWIGEEVESNEYLCNLKWTWCPDCLWGEDNVIHLPFGDGDIRGYCVGNEGETIFENTTVVYASGKTETHKVAKIDFYDCIFVNDLEEPVKVYLIPSGSQMDVGNGIKCKCDRGSLSCNQELNAIQECIASGGVWYTDHCCGDDPGEVSDQNACPDGYYFDPGTCSCTQNQPPVVTILSPSDGSTFVAPATVTIRWDAYDPDGDAVSITIDCGNGYTGTVQGQNEYSCDYSLRGTYTISVTAKDAAGATGSDTKTIYVVEDRGPPSAFLDINVLYTYTNPLYPFYVIEGSCTAYDDTAISEISVYVSSENVASCDTSPCQFSKNLGNTNGGCYPVSCQVTDIAGNTTNVTKDLAIIKYVDPAAGAYIRKNYVYGCDELGVCQGIIYLSTGGTLPGCLAANCVPIFGNSTVINSLYSENTTISVEDREYMCIRDGDTFSWMPLYYYKNYVNGCSVVPVSGLIICNEINNTLTKGIQQGCKLVYDDGSVNYLAPGESVIVFVTSTTVDPATGEPITQTLEEKYVCEYNDASYTYSWAYQSNIGQPIGRPQPVPIQPS